MAKHKQRKRRPSAGATGARQPSPSPAQRQERKQAARERREREAKAAARRGTVRRAFVGAVVGVLVLLGFTWYTNRAPASTALTPETTASAGAAGCDPLVRPDPGTPSREHLSPGASYSYSQQPATSGVHDPSPLPSEPRVYDANAMSQYSETKAVHTLEHGSVIMYYRPSSDAGGLPVSVVNQLGPVAESSPATYLIPYPNLPQGTALAYTAWNQLLTCPAKITPAQAETVARGFIQSFACTSNAPEASLGYGC